LMRAAVFLHPRIDEANAEPAEAAYPLASRRGLSQDRWLFGPPLAGRGCRGRSSRCAGPDSEDKQASHKRKRMLATSPVASGMKPTSSIADTSPGHNQKEEERQKCKGDGYDHFCSAEQGRLPQPMSARSKSPCGTKSTFMPWSSFDRNIPLERRHQ
jgi:hypothetical protein